MTAGYERTVVALLLVAVVAAPVAGAGATAGGVSSPDDTRATAPEAFALQEVDADAVQMDVVLQANGDAKWTIEYRVRLETDNETDAFRSLREEVRSNPENFTDRFGDRMAATAATAENATGREMAVRNVTVSAEVQEVPRYGILTYRFEWTNFAATDGDEIRAGDAIAGLFLDEQTRLTVRWPDDYELATATPEPTTTRQRSVVWEGPLDFGGEEPRVVVTTTGGLIGALPVVAGVVVLLVLAAVVAVWWSRGGLSRGGAGDPGDEPQPEPTDAAGAADAAADDGPPPELLSNEERVLRFVEQRGGRVKQQEIVEELDWTEAKTSQVVRDLRESGELEGFRLGRENVLRLPDADEASDGNDN
ncbi:MAG: hypothetical protein V5A23_01475 [Halobacteriales archaeon]